jgi:hypothetical protein
LESLTHTNYTSKTKPEQFNDPWNWNEKLLYPTAVAKAEQAIVEATLQNQ